MSYAPNAATRNDMDTLLSRVVWSALTSRQHRFSRGENLALKFDPDVSPFAASKDNSPEALSALADLMSPKDPPVYLLQADEIALPSSLKVEMTALGVLMTEQTSQPKAIPKAPIVPLQQRDIAEMVSLADLTKPGPFAKRTPELGQFYGVRLDGRLAAMAGTRLNLDGFTEISGICTHPDFRGRGLASDLSIWVASKIRERGDTPFLHAYADNDGAIALYRKLGFEIWSEVNVAVVRRLEGSAD